MKLRNKARIDGGNSQRRGEPGGRERLIKRKCSTRKSNCVPSLGGAVVVLLEHR